MKLISVSLARAAWLLDLSRANPKGKSLLDEIFELGRRYKFAKFPQHLLDYNKDSALEFSSGTFEFGGTKFRVGLTIYNNAVVADSLSSTSVSEALLQDVAGWLERNADVHVVPHILTRSYESQLDIEADLPPYFLNPGLDEVAKKLSAQATAIDGKPREYRLGGFAMWPEDIGKPASPSNFRFERKWGVSNTSTAYFSTAPLKTEQHLELLQDLERVLNG
jgi:hypothetical protein